MTIKQKKTKSIEQELLEKELTNTRFRAKREEYKNKYSREANKRELEEALDDYS